MQLDMIETLVADVAVAFVAGFAGTRFGGREFRQSGLVRPVSATGCSPQIDPETGNRWGFGPKDVNPIWAEVPLLYSMSRWMQGLVPYYKATASDEKRGGRISSSGLGRHPDPARSYRVADGTG